MLKLCESVNYESIQNLVNATLNEDVQYSTQPIELRNQRVYAIKAGVNGFLDVARQTYKEANEDAFKHIGSLNGKRIVLTRTLIHTEDGIEEHEVGLDLKFDPARQFYIRIALQEINAAELPDVFINRFRRRNALECQTLELVKLNQKIADAHNEVVNMSDNSIQKLVDKVRVEVHPLFKVSECIAILDMLSGFAQVVSTQDYVKPTLELDTVGVKSGRHPIREKIQSDKYIPNDYYASPAARFQIITGCNMSGKSTYIRSIALLTVMAQIGCFIPAQYASIPIRHQLYARISTDDSIEANVSTFAAEMREVAFIIRNVEARSLVIIDELGRGTSTTDGLAIAIAIAEAFIESRALVWFVTHFRDLPRILAERAGVVNLHLTVDVAPDKKKMKMQYRVADGYEEEKYYGLLLAKVVQLPPVLLETATSVSESLYARNDARITHTRVLMLARKRKLISTMIQSMKQAATGNLRGKALKQWLQRLQEEFLVRMQAIDAEVGNDEKQAWGDKYEIFDDESMQDDRQYRELQPSQTPTQRLETPMLPPELFNGPTASIHRPISTGSSVQIVAARPVKRESSEDPDSIASIRTTNSLRQAQARRLKQEVFQTTPFKQDQDTSSDSKTSADVSLSDSLRDVRRPAVNKVVSPELAVKKEADMDKVEAPHTTILSLGKSGHLMRARRIKVEEN